MALTTYRYRRPTPQEIVDTLPEYVNHTPTYPDPTLQGSAAWNAETIDVQYDSACKTDLDAAMLQLGWRYDTVVSVP